MTINSAVRSAGPFLGIGAIISLPFSFKVFQATDLVVTRTDTSGALATLVLSVDYTVTLNGDQNANPGGSVNLLAALAVGYTCYITSNLPATQGLSLKNLGALPPGPLEDALDRLCILAQQAGAGGLTSALRVPENTGIAILPSAAGRAGTVQAWDALGNPAQVAVQAAGSFTYGQTVIDNFTGDGVTTLFTLSANPGAQTNLLVIVGGVVQKNGADFTWTSGTALTFTSAPPATSVVVRYVRSLPIGTVGADGVSFAQATAYLPGSIGWETQRKGAVVSSIAALRLLLKTGVPKCFVTGYYADGDGGGGHYYYDSGDISTADNGGTVIVAADGARWKLVLVTFVAAKQFGAKGDNTADDTAPLQAWAAACSTSGVRGYLPPGTYRTTSTITIASGVHLFGQSQALSIIRAGGCDGITTAVGSGGFNVIEGMQIRSSNAVFGVDDPKTNKGVNSAGTSGAHVSNLVLRNVYLRGWLHCTDWQYTWNSVLDNVDTINCTYGLRVFGQSVNNSIANSRLLANGGTASIVTTVNGADRGEGLMVSNTLLSSGTYGVQSDGFLAMHFGNCITDLIADTGFKFTGAGSAFSYKGGWVYAANRGFSFDDLGVLQDLGNTIDTYITTTAANSIGIAWGLNCKGLSLPGGEITIPNQANVYALYFNGSKVAVGPVLISDNSSAGHSVFVNTNQISGINNLQGDVTITYNVTPVVTVASATALTLPKTNDFNSFSITGTTAVTSIPAANWAGQTVRLVFTGILTFTNGSNLKLTGNFVTAAGSSIVLWCDGTNFYEVGRKA